LKKDFNEQLKMKKKNISAKFFFLILEQHFNFLRRGRKIVKKIAHKRGTNLTKNAEKVKN
jgi:hypothetical protein